MGHQFVMGRDIEDALKRATDKHNARYRFSFDMLGEAALTAADARKYYDAYIEGHISFDYLERKCPFVAREVRRQGLERAES